MCFSLAMNPKSAARLGPKAEEAARRLDLILKATIRDIRQAKEAAKAFLRRL